MISLKYLIWKKYEIAFVFGAFKIQAILKMSV